MRNVILEDNDMIQLIAKIYIDGSIRFVKRWKKERCQNEVFYITSDELNIFKTYLINNKIKSFNCSNCVHRFVCSTEHYYFPENNGTSCKNYKRN